jgi:polysaccharide pyruvyl transferase CsaB
MSDKNIAICGAYGAGNIGDEAILAGIIQTVKKEFPEYAPIALTHHPEETKSIHNIAAYPVIPAGLRSSLKLRHTKKHLANTNLVIIGGGGILYDHGFHPGDSNPIRTWWLRTEVLRMMKIPYIVFAVGAGPIKGLHSKVMLRRILEGARNVSARDSASQKLLSKISPRTAIINIPDPAFALAPPGPKHIHEVIVIVRRWFHDDTDRADAFKETLVSALQHEASQGSYISLLPFVSGAEDDIAFAEEIAEMVGENAKVLAPPTSPAVAIDILASARKIISMRLHGMILGAIASRPIVPIAYSPKVKAIAEQLSLEPLDIEELDEETLINSIQTIKSPELRAGELSMEFRLKARDLISSALH